MNRYLLILTALSLACSVQRRDEADNVITPLEAATPACPTTTQPNQSSSAIAPSPSVASTSAEAPETHPGYRTAADYLLALFDCVTGPSCHENAKRILDATPSFTVDLPHVKNSSPCLTVLGLLDSSWCGMFRNREVSTFRNMIMHAVDCLTSTHQARIACIARSREIELWIGSNSCSKKIVGVRMDEDVRRGEFKANQPWALDFYGRGIATWSLCLEGYGEKVTGLSLASSYPGE